MMGLLRVRKDWCVACCLLLWSTSEQQVVAFSSTTATNKHHHRNDASPATRRGYKPLGAEPASNKPSSNSQTTLESLELENIDWEGLGSRVWHEVKHISGSLGTAAKPLFKSDDSVTPEAIVAVCDELDAHLARIEESSNADTRTTSSVSLSIRKRALKFQRYELLAKLMRQDYDAYIATASFLSPSRIPRLELPNVQDVPYDKAATAATTAPKDEDGMPLVPDCELENMKYEDSLLDKTLLSIFRKLVAKNTGGVTSDKEGIVGLLDQGRTFMLQPGQTPEAQHKMVSDTLGGLMTPVLPPFYRIFMSGIVPKVGSEKWDGKQLGPWFYAPFLTSIVTPTFFGFLVGPSRPNRRKDGQPGGLVVEKCKFLQESGCKGLCLHQCKLPAQQFFQEELGLPLTVQPNFVTQECQWSFGETPVPVAKDPTFPKGCLVGCESRRADSKMEGAYLDLCN